MDNITKELYRDYFKDAAYGKERYDWIVRKFLKDIKNKVILDIGCGVGTLLLMLKENNNSVYGIDVSETGIKQARENGLACDLVDLNIETLPFTESYFDIVICLETIEHLENPYHCLREIRRILKPEGMFLVSIPNPKILHPYFYPAIFTINNFSQLLKLASFEIKQIAGWGQAVMFKRALNLLGRGWLYNIIYFIGRKLNLLMRNHLGTPLSFAHCFNFECINNKGTSSYPEIEKELSLGTRPKK